MIHKGDKHEAGERVLVKTFKEDIEGILLESYDADVLLIKLNNGYNVGIDRSNIVDIKTIKKAEKQDKREEDFKLSNKKPIIDLIVTGGTLSSSLDVKTGGVKSLTSPGVLFKFYPEIFELADIRIINPFMKWSENMNFEDWQKIAKIVVKSLNDENVKGVIVTHGTDFLHYTSAALSFMIRNLNKPVALTYSQRSTDRGSSDATLNLYCAAKYALSDIAEIALVGHGSSSDDFCYALSGTKVRKLHTSRRDAFKSVNTAPIAKIFKDKIEVLKNYNKRKSEKDMKGKKVELEDSFEENIALVKFYPGQDPEILNYYFRQGYKGIVVEMSGLGHVLTEGDRSWVGVIKNLVDKGMVICASGQTIFGTLDPMVYEAGRRLEKAGVIYLKDMLSETAFVKLGWVLGRLKNKEIKKEDVRDLLLKNISGEFNDRLGEEF